MEPTEENFKDSAKKFLLAIIRKRGYPTGRKLSDSDIVIIQPDEVVKKMGEDGNMYLTVQKITDLDLTTLAQIVENPIVFEKPIIS